MDRMGVGRESNESHLGQHIDGFLGQRNVNLCFLGQLPYGPFIVLGERHEAEIVFFLGQQDHAALRPQDFILNTNAFPPPRTLAIINAPLSAQKPAKGDGVGCVSRADSCGGADGVKRSFD